MSSARGTTRVRAVLAAVGAALLATALATPAGASPPVVNEHFVQTDSHIEQEAHEGFCPEVPFLVEFTGHASITFRLLVRGKDGPEYGSFRITSQDTYTNLENGRTMTVLDHFQDWDHRVTDNGDGTLTIEIAGHSSTKLFDDDGHHLVAIDAGPFTLTLEIDLMDPDNPDDDVVVEGPVTEHGINTFGDRDLCESLVQLLS